jgi:hypothetical protein
MISIQLKIIKRDSWRSIMGKNYHRRGLIFFYLIVSLVLFACSMPSWLGQPPSGEIQLQETIQARVLATERQRENIRATDTPSQWTIEQCNALPYVSIEVEHVDEYTVDEGHIECDYAHKITNTSGQPVWIVYYKHWYYGENPLPNDYEFGWHNVAPRQPGESWLLSGFLLDCTTCAPPPRFESLYLSIAVVFDSPQCLWVVEGGSPHFEILQIAEEEPVLSPCTILYPTIYSNMPDITEGLRK